MAVVWFSHKWVVVSGGVVAICYTLYINCNFVLLQNTGVIVIINIICEIVFAAQIGADGK